MRRSKSIQYTRAVLCAALCFSLTVVPCWGWGTEGHRLTTLVAEQYLTPAVRAEITKLLHGQSMADIASWADDYRTEHPETGKWHYIDIPGTATAMDRDRDCPLSVTDPKSPWRDCVTDRILFFEGRLGDEALTADERATALKFLVHLIGDVHQPFHAIGDARGGNNLRVTFLGSTQCGTFACNLHGVWDESLIEAQGLSEPKYLARLLKEIKENEWEKLSGGAPSAWANVSHHYAVLAETPNGAILMRDYAQEESKVVDAQLSLGGLRLARALNRILGTSSPAPKATPGNASAPK